MLQTGDVGVLGRHVELADGVVAPGRPGVAPAGAAPEGREEHGVVGDDLELLEVVRQDIGALVEITLVELVGDRETLGTELPPTQDQGMVEAQSEEQGLELIGLGAGIDPLLVEVGEGSVQVVLQ